jgi:type IV pilus assembly protein PilC
MNSREKFLTLLILFVKILACILVLGLSAFLLVQTGPFGIGLSLMGVLANFWVLYAFLRSRESRQDELYQVLSAAVDRGIPVVSAVRSYVDDRPRLIRDSSDRSDWYVRCVKFGFLFLVYLLVLPLYGCFRLFIGFQSFDGLVLRFARRLERGESLSDASRKVRGVCSREVRLAIEVGDATGSLAVCLKGANRERWSAAWLELMPRLLYPFFVLLLTSSVVTFLMLTIMPRFRRIFNEFGTQLPSLTLMMIDVWNFAQEYAPFVFLAFALGSLIALTVALYPSVRWRTPLVGRLYRWGIQGEILRTLGRLLGSGQTVPQALGFLARSSVLPSIVVRRLAGVTLAVEAGQPLNETLYRAGLLPATMGPLLNTSQRVGNLPWAMVQLGDNLVSRAYRLVRRLSLIAAPISVMAVGAVVCFVVVGMFLPLIKLLTNLSQ